MDLLAALGYVLLFWRTFAAILVCGSLYALYVSAWPNASTDVAVFVGMIVVAVALARDVYFQWRDEDK